MNKRLQKMLINKSYCLMDMIPHTQNKHFSFIIRKNKILSFGFNNPNKTHPLAFKMKYAFPFTHSELRAIKNFPFAPANLEHCFIVNIRVDKLGNLNMSAPCKNCERMLKFFEIKDVFYTDSNGEFKYRCII